MLDEKKIEEAARVSVKASKYYDWMHSSAFVDGFTAGVNWANKNHKED